MVDAETVRSLLRYDQSSGLLFWLKNRGQTVKAGAIAGSRCRHITKNPNCETINEYIVVKIMNHPYLAHRVAWLLVNGDWPKEPIDHVDRDGTNNKWANLRLASTSQNAANRALSAANTTGFKGVTFNKKSRRFQASIKHAGRSFYLGLFDTPEGAHEAYRQAASRLHGEFARTS